MLSRDAGVKTSPADPIHERPEIRSEITERGDGVATIMEGKIVSLSIETKVVIAVATGFVLMVVGAMAQG